MGKPILAFAEQRANKFKKSAYEVVSEGRRLADKLGRELISFVVGSDVMEMAANIGAYGADKVLVADDEMFKFYSPQGYARVIADQAGAIEPEIILFPADAMGKDLAPRVAARLEAGLASDSTEIKVSDDGRIEVKRPVYAGKAFVWLEFESDPKIISLRPNVFPILQPDESKKASVEQVEVGFSADELKAVVKEVSVTSAGRPELTEADIIVSGGRGMKGPENYPIIEALADQLGAAVGASRASVDAGWRPHSDQVGQTGKTVSPNLYVACGISGAIQHLAGMSSSKYIVAINKDAEAPIFKVADYGIVGDLFEVVPAMTEAVTKLKQSEA